MPTTVQPDQLPAAMAEAMAEVTAEARQDLTEPPVHPTVDRTRGGVMGFRAVATTDPTQDLTTGLMPDPITDLTMAVTIGHMRVPTTDPTDPMDGAGPITGLTIDRTPGGISRFHLSLFPDSLFISVSSRHMKSQWRKGLKEHKLTQTANPGVKTRVFNSH
jgi:hypothetical protein